MYLTDAEKLLKGKTLVFDSKGNAYTFLDIDDKGDLIVACPQAVTGKITLIRANCRRRRANQSFPLSENERELIHRVFGGVKIDEEKVSTCNTGGWVMNDFYTCPCGGTVVVSEMCCAFYKDDDTLATAEYEDVPHFDWDEPLWTKEELSRR